MTARRGRERTRPSRGRTAGARAASKARRVGATSARPPSTWSSSRAPRCSSGWPRPTSRWCCSALLPGPARRWRCCAVGRADPRPVVWVRLEPADDDPVVLLRDAGGGARRRGAGRPGRRRVARAHGAAGPRARPAAARRGARCGRPFLLVLDDAQVIGERGRWDVVDFVLRHLPPGAQLAVGTRADPELSLARLRAAGELAEFRLRRSGVRRGRDGRAGPAHRRAASPIPTWWRRCSRPPRGGRSGCAAPASPPAQQPTGELAAATRRRAAGTSPPTSSSEVVERQPAEIQEFLLRTSVLRQLTPASCRGRDRPGRRRRAPRSAAPARSSSSSRSATTGCATAITTSSPRPCSTELERRHPGEPRRLHRLAGAWCAEQDDPDGAVYHLLAGRDVAGAADVVASSWPVLWDKGPGRDGAALAALVRRPADPGAQGTHAHRRLGVHRPGRRGAGRALGPRRLRRADDRRAVARRRLVAPVVAGAAARDRGAGRRPPHARGRRAGRQAGGHPGHQLARRRPGGARGRALALGLHAARAPSAGAGRARGLHVQLRPPSSRRWATSRSSPSSRRSGRSPRSTRRAPRRASRSSASAPAAGVCPCCSPASRSSRATRTRTWRPRRPTCTGCSSTWCRTRGWRSSRTSCSARSRWCGRTSSRPRRTPRPPRPCSGGTRTPGVLRQHVGAPASGRRGRASRSRSRPRSRRVLDLLPTHFTEVQIAEQLFVSHNTVKTHVKSVYRKLGASSRAGAVQRARDIGLLPPV